ncbi:long-chain fatty acid--CoA ligase [Pseudonocardia sp. MCCB 268]|nr:long-chain fatty acid--CoA ligase [Pseudonocardia cytotoxica]
MLTHGAMRWRTRRTSRWTSGPPTSCSRWRCCYPTSADQLRVRRAGHRRADRAGSACRTPEALLDMVAAEGITHTFWVPALMAAMRGSPARSSATTRRCGRSPTAPRRCRCR